MLGDGAMEKMAVSNVLISGLGGLGVEIGMKDLEMLIILSLYIICTYFSSIILYFSQKCYSCWYKGIRIYMYKIYIRIYMYRS